VPHGSIGNTNSLKYDVDMHPKTAKFLAGRGARLSDIADSFEVSTSTIHSWMNRYPEFLEAINTGNDSFDPLVERSLAERALGFFVDVGEERVKNPETDQWETKKIRKYFPPDTTAII